MANDSIYHLFPQKRIRPYDGMPVTAEIWEQSHTYHDQVLQTHNLFFHGAGILAGLEVVASDPPDRLVYILPGVAIDRSGKAIVLAEPVAYDIGNDVEGPLFLLLSHRESAPRANTSGSDTSPDYIEAQFLIIARSNIPDQPVVELARFHRESRQAPICDAADPLRPAGNEIDLRYRRTITRLAEPVLPAGVVYMGKVEKRLHGRGLATAACELLHAGHLHLVVDDDQQLGPNILSYGLVYLVMEGKVAFTGTQIKGLQGYLERGGALLVECCNEAARAAFVEVTTQIGAGLQRIPKDHPLMTQPYLFAAPPQGYEKTGELLVGEGVVLSTFNYGLVLAGEAGPEGSPPSRETIRAVVEWLVNVLRYTSERRAEA